MHGKLRVSRGPHGSRLCCHVYSVIICLYRAAGMLCLTCLIYTCCLSVMQKSAYLCWPRKKIVVWGSWRKMTCFQISRWPFSHRCRQTLQNWARGRVHGCFITLLIKAVRKITRLWYQMKYYRALQHWGFGQESETGARWGHSGVRRETYGSLHHWVWLEATQSLLTFLSLSLPVSFFLFISPSFHPQLYRT